ncbi:hypothetical protein ES319_A09G098700v1 [Gossypium barbadense]|uniref:Uncharacterized protein n=2 Tax=Gossypium TaxID=3633 RepID=A0A5J5UD16_GOSBA|nr:hypothetical protein ES319_A09G098700v1 [Gossypium barbadense]TYH02178.1 hypothetical protein ES288_A09G118300v1 [Gossypium darwinii]
MAARKKINGSALCMLLSLLLFYHCFSLCYGCYFRFFFALFESFEGGDGMEQRSQASGRRAGGGARGGAATALRLGFLFFLLKVKVMSFWARFSLGLGDF